eukprot:TRINITY_DN11654_c0_g1_i4.p1 TRINITY_DN11654_c0_g1~~TRINITY_DN11654_c0_g1_i4.p1  ORF type:complete len:171 (-),score=17.93 TRINITY_DN11654_c0_g1_i4:334-846(-)
MCIRDRFELGRAHPKTEPEPRPQFAAVRSAIPIHATAQQAVEQAGRPPSPPRVHRPHQGACDARCLNRDVERIASEWMAGSENINARERDARRLKAAASRVARRISETGGFTGLTREEALDVGEHAHHVGDVMSTGRWSATHETTLHNLESDPTIWGHAPCARSGPSSSA